jgi:hypothetical protein
VFILFRRINEFPHAGVTIRVAGRSLTYDRRAMTDRVPAITVLLLDLASAKTMREVEFHAHTPLPPSAAEPAR